MSKKQHNDTFYLSFANVACRVHAPKEWHKYFAKFYSSTLLVRYTTSRPRSAHLATITIHTSPSRHVRLTFMTHASLAEYDIYASNDPLFLFPAVHQLIARIFNIMFHLAGGFVLHASAIYVGGKTLIFAGESGRGKSTIVDMIHEHIPHSFILSDNSVFIRQQGKQFVMYPSPYLEANRIHEGRLMPSKPAPYPIDEVYFPFHAQINRVSPLPFITATQLIQKNSHIPYSPNKLFTPSTKARFGKTIFRFLHTVSPQKLEFAKSKAFLYHIHL